MRFHHSTRRGRNRLGHNQHQLSNRYASSAHHSLSSSSRWSQLSYCRETNIHFNRRLPIEPPVEILDHSPTFSSQFCPPTTPQHHKSVSSTGQQQLDSSAKLMRSSLKNSMRLKQKNEQEDDLNLQDLSLKEERKRSKQRMMASDNGAGQNSTEEDSLKQLGLRRHNSNSISNSESTRSESQSSTIDMESARQKLVAQVEKHRLWSSKAARRMQLTSVQDRNIYIYELTSFCERRELEWRYEAFRGGLVSSIPFSADRLSSSNQFKVTTSRPISPSNANEILAFAPIQKKMVVVKAAESRPCSSGIASSSVDSFWSKSSSGVATGARTPIKRAGSTRTATGTKVSHSSAATACSSPTKSSQLNYELLRGQDRAIPSTEYVWSIETPAQMKPQPFMGQVYQTELPNSSFVKRCHGCQGKGKLKCHSCNGVGYEVCISCHGNGTTKSLSSSMNSSGLRSKHCYAESYPRNSTFANGYDTERDNSGTHSSANLRKRANEPGGITSSGANSTSGSAWVTESCHFCHGAGQKRCLMCAGRSYNVCQGCLGAGQLRCYLNLNITWINHREESILNNSDNIIPRERLRLCNGLLLADEVGDSSNLSPLRLSRVDGATGRPDELNQLNLVSKKLIDKHKQTYNKERLIKQVSCCYMLAPLSL